MFRYDDQYVILCQEPLHLLDLSSDASGRCALAGRPRAKFGVMMGRCVRAHVCGRYPSSQPDHEEKPPAVMQRTRPDRRCPAGFDRLPGSPGGNAARGTKSRQGYGSYFASAGPLFDGRGALGLIELRNRPVRAPNWEFAGAREVLAASRGRRDASPARSLRRARACNDSAPAEVDVRCARFRPQGSEHRRHVESAAGKAPAFFGHRPKTPEKYEGIRVCKRKGSVQIPAYF